MTGGTTEGHAPIAVVEVSNLRRAVVTAGSASVAERSEKIVGGITKKEFGLMTNEIIYRLRMETFKQDYVGYWSSLEAAKLLLPNCVRFHEVLGWRLPSRKIGEDFDWAHNKKLKPVLTEEKDGNLRVVIPGFRWVLCTYDSVPEIKEPGKPYQPASAKLVDKTTKEVDQHMGTIYVDKIALNEVLETR